MAAQTNFVGDNANETATATAQDLLREEKIFLQSRLASIREGLNQVQKENSMLKMRSTIALGQCKLQVESVEDDNQYLVEKYFDLKRKAEASERSLESKSNELAALQSVLQHEDEEIWKRKWIAKQTLLHEHIIHVPSNHLRTEGKNERAKANETNDKHSWRR